MASTSGLRAPVCGPPLGHSFVPGDDPALGFASCRVVGHIAVHRTRPDPACDHQPPEPAHGYLPRADPIRSWAFATLLPLTHKVPAELPAVPMVREGEGFLARAFARFAAALQRVDGADALSDLTPDHTA
jgi:hypothetical protein